MQLTPEIVEKLVKSMPHADAAELLAMFDELEERKTVQAAQDDFLAFIAAVDRTYKFGVHLKRLGNLLMDVEQNVKNRIAVSMAPRMGKSQMISIYYPAWYLGRHPDHKVIVASHTADLAVVMARKVRNLIQSPEYARIFPNTKIASDAKAAAQWNTTQGGEYFAIGVGVRWPDGVHTSSLQTIRCLSRTSSQATPTPLTRRTSGSAPVCELVSCRTGKSACCTHAGTSGT